MGLCKCPKRKVTQQFCFEHKIYACEFCMLSSHSRCVVRSYFQWLEDSNYEPNCTLCGQNLSTDLCVRLLCYHIFHWNCLDNYANNIFTANSKSDSSINCPECKTNLVPASNHDTPLADELRRLLSTAQWCRGNLSKPSLQFSLLNDTKKEVLTKNNDFESTPRVVAVKSDSFKHSPPVVIPLNHITNSMDSESNLIPNARKFHNSNHAPRIHTTILDVDEDKYRRRTLMESISKWLRSHRITVHGNGISLKGSIFLVLIALFTVAMLIHYFLKLGRETAERDPLLDPRSNPNIKVSDD